MPSITLSTITRRFATGGGVNDISLSIAAGEHLVVVGPSGAGKTTLLRLIAGLETPDAGRIQFGDRDVLNAPPHERRVAFVGQRPGLYSHLDVRANLAAGVTLRQWSRRWWRRVRGVADPVSASELAGRVADAARWLGLTPLLDRPVDGLSGGEQQRVALGRAVVAQHAMWLLDEPLAHLDPLTRDELRWQLLLLRDRMGPTIIEVTHDPGGALTLGHRIAVLHGGRLAQVGSPAEVYARPNSRAVATSLGWPPMNIIDGPAAPDAGATGAACAALGVRPEDVALGRAAAGAVDLGEWELQRVDALGPRPLWTLVRGQQRLRRWADDGDEPAPRVHLHVKPGREHWFDGD